MLARDKREMGDDDWHWTAKLLIRRIQVNMEDEYETVWFYPYSEGLLHRAIRPVC